MVDASPSVFIINIHPDNWDECISDHIFGIRTDVRHPKFNKGDIFLVRRTGKDYGVMGIWRLLEEKEVSSQDEVPWHDAEYKWQQRFEPVVDFTVPMSEEFSGTSKFSDKLQVNAMRLVGSAVTLNNDEVVRYLDVILTDKADELSHETQYQGRATTIAEIIQSLRRLFKIETKTPIPHPVPKYRGMPVGEPINFRGMVYAPLNEAGVVLLFSKVMDDLGIIYESSPLTGFDMIGRQQIDKGYVQKNIEFEYKSSNFKTHGHDVSQVDYLVCWEHDWAHCPQDLQVIELREAIKDLPAQFNKDLDS